MNFKTTDYNTAFGKRALRGSALLATSALALGLVACGDGNETNTASGSQADKRQITVENCGVEQSYAAPVEKMLVNDANIIALALAVGAEDQISAVSAAQRGLPLLEQAFGPGIADKDQISEEYPNLEQVLAAEPDIYVAGWNYGFSESTGVNPDALAEHDIATYTLTESCRQEAAGEDNSRVGYQRGIVDPWEAVRIDLRNLGAITGNEQQADEVIADMDNRLKALEQAAQPEAAPVGLIFDSATEAPFTSGAFGAPQGILEKAGAVNAAADIEDTWTTTTWEKIAESEPDFIAFVDYPGQTFAEKVEMVRSNPATRDLEAVKENRFINLPYSMWTESPLNIDAAEYVRAALEEFGLAPKSEISPKLTLPEDLDGREYFTR